MGSLVTCPTADLGVADKERQWKKLELMVHLIDTELGVDGKACISSLPPPTPNQDDGGHKGIVHTSSSPHIAGV